LATSLLEARAVDIKGDILWQPEGKEFLYDLVRLVRVQFNHEQKTASGFVMMNLLLEDPFLEARENIDDLPEFSTFSRPDSRLENYVTASWIKTLLISTKLKEIGLLSGFILL